MNYFTIRIETRDGYRHDKFSPRGWTPYEAAMLLILEALMNDDPISYISEVRDDGSCREEFFNSADHGVLK